MPSTNAVFSSLSFILFSLLLWPNQLSEAQQICASCASTLLRSQWQATALPTIPPPHRFHFDDDCETGTKNAPLVNCSSVCMEMLLVAGGEYTIVRGCLADFYEGYHLPNLTPMCNFADFPVEMTMFEGNNEPKPLSRVYVGTIYCNEGNGCNNDLKGEYSFASSAKTWQNSKLCGYEMRQAAQVFQCHSCNRYDGNGDCDWDYKEYCNGQWCTKTIGYVNGRWVENRGCAPINPSGNSICVKLESSHEISQLSNQHLTLPYSLEQCFCQGGRCNGALSLSADVATFGTLLLSLTLTILLSFA